VVAILAISGVAFGAKWVPAPILPPWIAAPVVASTPSPAPASTPVALETPSSATAGQIAHAAVPPTSQPATNPPATPGQVVDLGPLGAADNLDGTLSFDWTAYSGGSFGGYELVYETTASAKTPSFLASSPSWAAPAQTDTSAVIGRPAPGSYQVRLQAIASVDGQAVVVAQTSIIHVHISAPASATP
jgi:hypothetical protein